MAVWGKTTTSVHSRGEPRGDPSAGFEDLDPQGNATRQRHRQADAAKRSITSPRASRVADVLVPCTAQLYVVPANRELAGAEIRARRIERARNPAQGGTGAAAARYDFI